jgi:hypothetical protein
MRLTIRILCISAFLFTIAASAYAQTAADCANLMKFGIYDKFRTFATESHYRQVQEFFQNNSFHSRQEAESKASDLGLDIKDVLNLSFGSTTSSSSYDVWQQQLLQTSFLVAESSGLSASSIETISGKITQLVGQCLNQKGLHAYIIPATDNQNFTLTVDFAPFSAAQASIPGTLTVTPASVAAQCSPGGILSNQVDIGPGGVALSCRRLPTETVTVVVNTPGNIGMSANFTYDAVVVPKPTIRFFATPDTAATPIDPGEPVKLTWEVLDALSVSLAPNVVPSADSRTVTPQVTTDYELVVTSLDGKRETKSLKVIVKPPQPTLVGARVFFHTTNDDKDRDTNLLVNVDCSSGTIATISGDFGNRWPDPSDNGPFDMSVLVPQRKNRIPGCAANLTERPVGNDEFHFDWWVELRFSDGSVLRRNGSGNVDSDRPHAHIDF